MSVNTYTPPRKSNIYKVDRKAYFPRFDIPISHFSPNVTQLAQGCCSITSHRIRRRLHVVHAFLARGLAGDIEQIGGYKALTCIVEMAIWTLELNIIYVQVGYGGYMH